VVNAAAIAALRIVFIVIVCVWSDWFQQGFEMGAKLVTRAVNAGFDGFDRAFEDGGNFRLGVAGRKGRVVKRQER
jgi:hypothetical protein